MTLADRLLAELKLSYLPVQQERLNSSVKGKVPQRICGGVSGKNPGVTSPGDFPLLAGAGVGYPLVKESMLNWSALQLLPLRHSL